MSYNYKCTINKNRKFYYKRVGKLWKKISHIDGQNAERGKLKYKSNGDIVGYCNIEKHKLETEEFKRFIGTSGGDASLIETRTIIRPGQDKDWKRELHTWLNSLRPTVNPFLYLTLVEYKEDGEVKAVHSNLLFEIVKNLMKVKE